MTLTWNEAVRACPEAASFLARVRATLTESVLAGPGTAITGSAVSGRDPDGPAPGRKVGDAERQCDRAGAHPQAWREIAYAAPSKWEKRGQVMLLCTSWKSRPIGPEALKRMMEIWGKI